MKKNFFKKLSFVLALAMIIATIAPAAGAFAATALHLNSTTRYLYLGGVNEYDFNISHATRGSKAAWLSSDVDVATVDETTGEVVAVAIGTATISVDVTAKDGTVTPLEATVIVRDNIATINSIYCQTDAKQDLTKLAVGKDYDFGRTFTTKGGSSTATSSKTVWTVNSTKATISTLGVFKATEAGDYTITVLAFQSTAKANEWKAAVATDATSKLNVLDSKTLAVKVVPAVVATKQVDLDTFTVTFDCDMSKSDFASKAVLYQMVGDNAITTGAEKIKEVKYDATGKIATVDVLAAFSGNVTYKLVSGDLVASFKAAAGSLNDVKTIVFDDFNVNVAGAGTDMMASVKGLNADGVVILTGAALAGNVTFTYGGDLTKGFTSGNTAYIYTVGYSAPVTANFSNYVYDDAQKKYVEVKSSDAAVATGVATDSGLKTSSVSFVLNRGAAVNADTTGWASTFSVPAGDGVFTINYRYQTNDITDGHFLYNTASYFTFTTNDPDKLLIRGLTMVPLAQGSVTVLVKNAAGSIVTTFVVNIAPARTFVAATPDVSGVTLGNSAVADIAESRNVKISVIDSQNETFAPVFVSSEITNAPVGVNKAATGIVFTPSVANNVLTVGVAVPSVTPGAYTVKVVVGGLGTATKDVYFTVIVLSAADAVVARWSPELSSASVDTKDLVALTNVTGNVYGYNDEGARITALTNAQFTIDVQSNGAAVTSHVDAVADTIGVVAPTAGTLDFYAPGTYVVAFKSAGAGNPTGRADGMVIGYVQLTVSDTTTKTCSIVTSSVTFAAGGIDTIGEAVLAAFDFTVNGTAIDAGAGTFAYFTSDGSAAVAGTNGAGAIVASSTLYIDHVTYTVGAPGSLKVYTIDVKKTIAIK